MKAKNSAATLTVIAWSACAPGVPRPPQFRDAASETGLVFRHYTGATGRFYMPEIMGAGVALLDYDGDGDLDIYLVQGTDLESGRAPLFPRPPGAPSGNRLFRNELVPSGVLRFTDVTAAAGAGVTAYGMGVASGDYDNDGFSDLYITNFGSNVLLHNNGNGTFTDVTREAGVDDPRWSTSASFLDYDGDGYLDLFVLNYVDFTVRGNKACYTAAGELDYCTPVMYSPVSARLFHNERNGRFRDATAETGIGATFGPGLGVASGDFNGDGRPDLYVANDTAANLLWINRGGRFQESALPSGAAYAEDGLPKAGMGVSAADFDNNGTEDLVVLNLKSEGATLFRNEGPGVFADASQASGIHRLTRPFTGFGVSFFDYDNDGWLDLFAASGAVTIEPGQRGAPYPFAQRNLLLRNRGGVFEDAGPSGGPALLAPGVARGAAFGDIDNDGDVDIVVAVNNGPARLLLNQQARGNHWLEVGLRGIHSNRQGLGARVTVHRRGAPPIVRRCHTDGSYLSAGDPRVHFGLGAFDAIESVIVEWPGGGTEHWYGVRPDRLLQLSEGSGRTASHRPAKKLH